MDPNWIPEALHNLQYAVEVCSHQSRHSKVYFLYNKEIGSVLIVSLQIELN